VLIDTVVAGGFTAYAGLLEPLLHPAV